MTQPASSRTTRALARPMKFGIRQKILLVLVGVLALSSGLNALLASFFTNRQNEAAAFAGLGTDLLAWQTDLRASAEQLRGVALATVGDAAILNQLAELITLESRLEDQARASERREMARTLGYRKTVALNRLQLALRTGLYAGPAEPCHLIRRRGHQRQAGGWPPGMDQREGERPRRHAVPELACLERRPDAAGGRSSPHRTRPA